MTIADYFILIWMYYVTMSHVKRRCEVAQVRLEDNREVVACVVLAALHQLLQETRELHLNCLEFIDEVGVGGARTQAPVM